jgi:GAF domain-containing protein
MRRELKKAQTLLEQYRAALRLARLEIERRNQSILTLTTFAYQAGCAATPAMLLKLALTRVLHISNTCVGAILLIDPETEELRLGVHKGLTPALARVLTGKELGSGAAALMPHLVAGSGALLERASAEDEEERLLLDAAQLSSLVSLPMQAGSRLSGAMLLGVQGERRFRPAELRFLMAISQQTALALESLELRKELWRTAEALLDGRWPAGEGGPGDQAELGLELPALLADLPGASPALPEPAGEDLEQLLAAMMEAEAEARRQNSDLQTLNTIAEMMNRTLELKAILRLTVEQTRSALGTHAAWLYLKEEAGRLSMRAQVGLSEEYVYGMRSVKVGDGIEGRVAAENSACFMEALDRDGRSHKIWVEREGLCAIAAVPIHRPEPKAGGAASQGDAQVLGVLATGQRGDEGYEWSPREMGLLTSIANHVALAIDNARLYAQVQNDEAGLRVGNQVLREINDMLLQKNAILEDFIEANFAPLVAISTRLLRHLKASRVGRLSERQVEKYTATLAEIVGGLKELARGILDVNISVELEEDESASPDEWVEEAASAPPSSGGNGQSRAKLIDLEEAVAAGLISGNLLERGREE